jgi:hypothetical protein
MGSSPPSPRRGQRTATDAGEASSPPCPVEPCQRCLARVSALCRMGSSLPNTAETGSCPPITRGEPYGESHLSVGPGHVCPNLVRRHRRGRIGNEPIVGRNHLVAQPRLDGSLTRRKRPKALEDDLTLGGVLARLHSRPHHVGHLQRQGHAHLPRGTHDSPLSRPYSSEAAIRLRKRPASAPDDDVDILR